MAISTLKNLSPLKSSARARALGIQVCGREEPGELVAAIFEEVAEPHLV